MTRFARCIAVTACVFVVAVVTAAGWAPAPREEVFLCKPTSTLCRTLAAEARGETVDATELDR